MNAQYAMNRYRTVTDETAIPEEILMRLLDGTLRFCEDGKAAMVGKDFALKGQRLMQAVAIIDELVAVLDKDAAPDVTANLARIYDFARGRLIYANTTLKPAAIDEAVRVLKPIRDAFQKAIQMQKAA
jgi:flagellar protein FliS